MGFFSPDVFPFGIVSPEFCVALSLIYHLSVAVICFVYARVTELHCIIEAEYYAFFFTYKENLDAKSIGPKLLK